MNVKIYRVSGVIEKVKILRYPRKKEGVITKRRVIYKFSKEILGVNEKDVIERIYSIFGSNYKVKRNKIKILEIKEIKEGEITDMSLKKMLEYIKNLNNV